MITTQGTLRHRVVVDNTEGFLRRPGRGRGNRLRDAMIYFEESKGEGFRVIATGRLFNEAPELLLGIIGETVHEIRSRVQYCRQVWKEQVVDGIIPVADQSEGGLVNTHPFRDQWDLSSIVPEGRFHEIMGSLARAGWVLFRTLFLDPSNSDLRKIGERLLQASQQSELVLTFMSDRFFVPWPMIYTHPTPDENLDHRGSNYRLEGFWGYRHLLEHKPERVLGPLVLPVNAAGKVPTGVGYGARIEQALIDAHRHFIDAMPSISCTERLNRDALAEAMRSPSFDDRFLYFFCHGLGEGDNMSPNLGEAGIALTDGKLITSHDLDDWLDGRTLPSEPFVFINACQGGHLATVFYDTLARRFLEKKAIALLGAQVDLPARFATEYAKRFIEEFLKRPSKEIMSSQPLRLGDLVRTLTRRFLDGHRNPLGLAYTLYRGLDCYVEWDNVGKSL